MILQSSRCPFFCSVLKVHEGPLYNNKAGVTLYVPEHNKQVSETEVQVGAD